jgi:hypothetical protein
MKFTKLIERILYSNHFKEHIPKFFKEVEEDIKTLKPNNPYYNNSNPVLNYFYQDEDRFDEELLTEVKEMTSKKYKENYCPASLFEYFNQSEKANYIILRVEIDKLLEIKNTFYQI